MLPDVYEGAAPYHGTTKRAFVGSASDAPRAGPEVRTARSTCRMTRALGYRTHLDQHESACCVRSCACSLVGGSSIEQSAVHTVQSRSVKRSRSTLDRLASAMMRQTSYKRYECASPGHAALHNLVKRPCRQARQCHARQRIVELIDSVEVRHELNQEGQWLESRDQPLPRKQQAVDGLQGMTDATQSICRKLQHASQPLSLHKLV